MLGSSIDFMAALYFHSIGSMYTQRASAIHKEDKLAATPNAFNSNIIRKLRYPTRHEIQDEPMAALAVVSIIFLIAQLDLPRPVRGPKRHKKQLFDSYPEKKLQSHDSKHPFTKIRDSDVHMTYAESEDFPSTPAHESEHRLAKKLGVFRDSLLGFN